MLRLISSLLIMLTMAGNAWCQQTDQPYHEAAGSERGYLHLGQSRAEQFSSVVSMDTIGGWNANPEAEALVYLLDAGWRKSNGRSAGRRRGDASAGARASSTSTCCSTTTA